MLILNGCQLEKDILKICANAIYDVRIEANYFFLNGYTHNDGCTTCVIIFITKVKNIVLVLGSSVLI